MIGNLQLGLEDLWVDSEDLYSRYKILHIIQGRFQNLLFKLRIFFYLMIEYHVYWWKQDNVLSVFRCCLKTARIYSTKTTMHSFKGFIIHIHIRMHIKLHSIQSLKWIPKSRHSESFNLEKCVANSFKDARIKFYRHLHHVKMICTQIQRNLLLISVRLCNIFKEY